MTTTSDYGSSGDGVLFHTDITIQETENNRALVALARDGDEQARSALTEFLGGVILTAMLHHIDSTSAPVVS